MTTNKPNTYTAINNIINYYKMNYHTLTTREIHDLFYEMYRIAVKKFQLAYSSYSYFITFTMRGEHYHIMRKATKSYHLKNSVDWLKSDLKIRHYDLTHGYYEFTPFNPNNKKVQNYLRKFGHSDII